MGAELEGTTKEAEPGQEVAFALVNHGPGPIGHGLPFDLQREKNGHWINVRFGPKNGVWELIHMTLPPGGRFEQSVEIPRKARPGRYRVAKWIDGTDEPAAFYFMVQSSSGR